MSGNLNLPNLLTDDIVANVEATLKRDKVEFELYESKAKPGKPSTINNGWDDMKVQKLKEWVEENKIYNWLLKTTSAHYSLLESVITIPLIIFTLAGVALSFLATAINNNSNDCGDVNIYIIMSVVVQMLGSILVLIKTFYGLSKIITSCNIMSRKFSALNTDIDEVLTEVVEERMNGTTYLREKAKERADLLTNIPEIPHRIWIKFHKALLEGSIIDMDSSVFMRRRHSSIIPEEKDKKTIDTKVKDLIVPAEINPTVITVDSDKERKKMRLQELSDQIRFNMHRY